MKTIEEILKGEDPSSFDQQMRNWAYSEEQVKRIAEKYANQFKEELRDKFAMAALPLIPFIAKEVYANPETWGAKEIANEAYRIADEMIKERKDEK